MTKDWVRRAIKSRRVSRRRAAGPRRAEQIERMQQHLESLEMREAELEASLGEIDAQKRALIEQLAAQIKSRPLEAAGEGGADDSSSAQRADELLSELATSKPERAQEVLAMLSALLAQRPASLTVAEPSAVVDAPSVACVGVQAVTSHKYDLNDVFELGDSLGVAEGKVQVADPDQHFCVDATLQKLNDGAIGFEEGRVAVFSRSSKKYFVLCAAGTKEAVMSELGIEDVRMEPVREGAVDV